MNPHAVAQARERLARAHEAADALRNIKTYEDAWRAWGDFLMAASSVYSKLEQGAKANGKSSAWFGRVKRLRKTDQLLSYLHHARNTEEHGIEDSLSLKAPKLERIALDAEVDPTKHEKKFILRGKNQKAAAALKVTIQPGLQLIAVTDDRYSDTFLVPSMHLGKQLTNMSVADLVDLSLVYLDSLVVEATALSE